MAVLEAADSQVGEAEGLREEAEAEAAEDKIQIAASYSPQAI